MCFLKIFHVHKYYDQATPPPPKRIFLKKTEIEIKKEINSPVESVLQGPELRYVRLHLYYQSTHMTVFLKEQNTGMWPQNLKMLVKVEERENLKRLPVSL